MPFSMQPDCGFLSPVGFAIRMNNGTQEHADPPLNLSQNPSFPSMMDFAQSLPASGPLVEYVRNQPPTQHLHSAVAPSLFPSVLFLSMMDLGQSLPPSGPLVEYVRNQPPSHHPHSIQQVHTPHYHTNSQQYPTSPESYMLVRSDQAPHLRVTEAPRTQYLSPTSITSWSTNSILSPTSLAWSPYGIFAEATPLPPNADISENENEKENSNTTHLTTQLNALALDPQSQKPMPIPKVCSHPECPVAEAHPEGLYQYESQRWVFRSYEANGISRAVFGESSASPAVYASLGRLVEGRGEIRDAVAVNAFQEAHFVGEGGR